MLVGDPLGVFARSYQREKRVGQSRVAQRLLTGFLVDVEEATLHPGTRRWLAVVDDGRDAMLPQHACQGEAAETGLDDDDGCSHCVRFFSFVAEAATMLSGAAGRSATSVCAIAGRDQGIVFRDVGTLSEAG